MSDFNWQTEVEQEWQNEEPQKPASRVRWAIAPLLAVALLLAGWSIYDSNLGSRRQINRQIRRSYAALVETASAHDERAARPFLSSRDQLWLEAQMDLISLPDGLLNRQLFQWHSLLSKPDIVEIALNDELNAAVISATVTFSDGEQEFSLLVPAVFRKGNVAWLYAPPLDSFWGVERSFLGSSLNLSAPSRDAVVAERLLNDFEKAIGECRRDLHYHCPSERTLQVTFSTDSRLLPALAETAPALKDDGGRLSLMLPTPTLIGLPTDAQGYAALRDGYVHLLLKPFAIPQASARR